MSLVPGREVMAKKRKTVEQGTLFGEPPSVPPRPAAPRAPALPRAARPRAPLSPEVAAAAALIERLERLDELVARSMLSPSAESPKEPAGEELPLTVAALGRLLERALGDRFVDPVLVEGEANGVRFAQSGHLYFTLKDEDDDATVDVVMYRASVTPRARGIVSEGARLRLRGKPSYYTPRGRLQFIADRVGLSGKGALLEALERLKARLLAEGLFAPERKRPLPFEPRIIGVVTSAAGAVIHDICRVAFRRGGAHILLSPAVVQGPSAARSIVKALALLQQVPEVDVIVVGRGGGSADDLAAFNDEAVVRAVAACAVPVVSAVGHEVDFTLVDFASDARASTPSQAAEMLVPDGQAMALLLAERERALRRAMVARLSEGRLELAAIAQNLGDPRVRVATAQQRLDDRRTRLVSSMERRLERERARHRGEASRLTALPPTSALARERAAVVELAGRVKAAFSGEFARRQTEVVRLEARLDAMSPVKVLARGYAIVTTEEGLAVRRRADVAGGVRVRVRVDDGSFAARVEPDDAPLQEPGGGPA